MSLAGGPQVWCLGVRGTPPDLLMGVPFHMTYPMMHLMLLAPSPPSTDRFLLKHYHRATSFAGGKNTIATRYTGRQSRFQTTGNYIMVYLTGVGVVTRSSAIRFVIPVLTCGIKRFCSYWLCPSLAFCFYWVNNHIWSDFHHGNQK